MYFVLSGSTTQTCSFLSAVIDFLGKYIHLGFLREEDSHSDVLCIVTV